MAKPTLRKLVFDKLEQSSKTDRLGRMIDLFLIALIAINVIAVVLETVDSIHAEYHVLFANIEIISVAIFSIEYLIRLWTCVENEEFSSARYPRLKYMLSPVALIDLVAILPFYLTFLLTIDLRFLRVLRLLRIFKLTRYSSAMTMLLDVFREESNAFFSGFFILLMLLILAASGAYLAEHEVQPEKFGSIPHAMWWAMATLTTVGYGDVTPVTPIGQVFGSLVAVVGIGMAALPAGILASGLTEQLQRRRNEMKAQLRIALEDGVIDADEEEELEEIRKTLGLSKRAVYEVRREVKRHRDGRGLYSCPKCGAEMNLH